MNRSKHLVQRLGLWAVWVLLGSGGPATLLVAGGGPAAVVQEETHDSGRVLQGKKIDHAFIVTNKGTAVLNILSAKPG